MFSEEFWWYFDRFIYIGLVVSLLAVANKYFQHSARRRSTEPEKAMEKSTSLDKYNEMAVSTAPVFILIFMLRKLVSDFALFLVICTFVCLALWVAEIVMKRFRSPGKSANPSEELKFWLKTAEYAKSFFPVFLAVLVLRSFLVEPFKIPSSSMVPTLKIGDFILVNKYYYGFRLPVLNTKVLEMNKPKRGDVVVFRFEYPRREEVNFIKRIIGLPGDEIQYIDAEKKLVINGKEIPHKPLLSEKSLTVGNQFSHIQANNGIFIENLDGVEHSIRFASKFVPDFHVKVPPGHYAVFGDNRDESFDSRLWRPEYHRITGRQPPDNISFVADEKLVGRAFFIWFNLNFDVNSWSQVVNWSRIGGSIK